MIGTGTHIRHGQLLKRKIDLGASLLASVTNAFWDHPRFEEMFPEFLMAIHGSVRATVPLMQAAAEAARQQGGDPVCAVLTEYFPKHIAEELDHDEWLLRDLEAIGIDRKTVLQHPPLPAIAGMVGAQYYWIFHSHPVALLGFFAVLEGHPPDARDLAAIQRKTQLPPEAFRMLQHHSTNDEVHAAELYALLDNLPLNAFQSELIGVSAFHTIAMLQLLFAGFVDRFASSGSPA